VEAHALQWPGGATHGHTTAALAVAEIEPEGAQIGRMPAQAPAHDLGVESRLRRRAFDSSVQIYTPAHAEAGHEAVESRQLDPAHADVECMAAPRVEPTARGHATYGPGHGHAQVDIVDLHARVRDDDPRVRSRETDPDRRGIELETIGD